MQTKLNYEFNLQNYSGPLDLLLELVKDKKISILDINVLELANQYLKIINEIKNTNLDIAAEYLNYATIFIYMKAKYLSNKPEDIEIVTQEKQKLINDLIEYKQFKEIKDALSTFQKSRQEIYIKKPSNVDEFIIESDSSRLDGHSSITTLISTLRKMFERVFAQELRKANFSTVKINSADQIKFIKNVFGQRSEVKFEEIFTQPSLTHFVITLIALLDLARQQFLTLKQDSQYGEIKILRNFDNNEE
ncbi:segregation/condensation protein A [Mycoplasmopsis synoviae]|uniref:segregation/condensation protein A n=1 Tax=Mycoplasmopsis synoviae TaxID=2109 RepID=UPI000CA32CF9|nr:segregation/condensation protein A [Mycoplasmopsis synoviae]AKJ21025.1 Segregation and condensation protein A [Mycoplasmopsis synoviae]AQU48360.1 Segregation and condensation protein A [Mycoplasmopsis synoviae]AWL83933.1 segregation/condensation protein A [Mycoplasmopsis synoviae]QLE13664.1 segregation/condensation protein A [Mycoplasmopsis synoviae]UZF64419.1 segregation/condensation protein A [Mycoplasmopsis synoviae]